jgi:hypothetical protein
MPLPEIVTAVTDRLIAVSGTRNVYSYPRNIKEISQFKHLFADLQAKNIHTWMVTREATEKRDEGIEQCRHIHSIVMMGYFSVNDAGDSESAFQTLIEEVCQAFDPFALRQYDGLVDWSQPVQVQGPTVLMYGPSLCHAVKLIHKVEEVLS